MAGAIAEGGGKASQNLISSLFSGVGQTAAAAFSGGGGESLGRLAMTKVSVSKYLGGEGTQLAVKQAAGVTMNPNTLGHYLNQLHFESLHFNLNLSRYQNKNMMK